MSPSQRLLKTVLLKDVMAIRSEKTVNTLFQKVQSFSILKQVVHLLTTYSEGL